MSKTRSRIAALGVQNCRPEFVAKWLCKSATKLLSKPRLGAGLVLVAMVIAIFVLDGPAIEAAEPATKPPAPTELILPDFDALDEAEGFDWGDGVTPAGFQAEQQPGDDGSRGVPAFAPSKNANAPRLAKRSELKFVPAETPLSPPLDDVGPGATATTLATATAQYDEQVAQGNLLRAHKGLSDAYWAHPEWRASLIERLDKSANTIFFKAEPHFTEGYVVKPGDQLRRVSDRYQLSWQYLAKLNHTDPRKIRPEQKLKVVRGPFAAVVDLGEFALTVHLEGYYVRRYRVGIGQDGSSPVGQFTVINKVENPQYTDPKGKVISADDPMNPLGERWIDLGDSYGIHGTIEPSSIGQAASRGCIRLGDADVVEVYDFLVKGSSVTIQK